jgi:hypothetical protein
MTKTQVFLSAAIALILTIALNYFVPAVLSLPKITFFQAMVLAVGVRSLAGANNVTFKKES